MRTYLRIAQLYLEDSDAMEAETYVNRASLLQAECKAEELQILYKVRRSNSHFNFLILFIS
jgi:COP9 signalosome complex subunit 4